MNVLQINTVCGTGSTGRIATDIHAILTSQGHQSTIAYGRDSAKNCSQAIRIGSRFDTYLHVAQTRVFDTHGFGSLSATRNFLSKVGELEPEIIHLHNIHGYYLHIGLLFQFLKHAKIPVIWTLHDCWAFTGHCAYFDFINCEKWKSHCHDCALKKEYPMSLFLDNSRSNFQQKRAHFTGLENLTIVTPSRWLRNLVKESFLKEYPVRVINNGIDLDTFRPTTSDFRTRHNLNGQFVVLGVASVWSERKGCDFFIELVKFFSSDVKVVLVGVDDALANRLPEEIVAISKTNSTSELAEIYSAADVFVNPTLEDNFPTTNLEALACGTPVITFDSGGSAECLGDGCGWVVDRGDLAGLITAIEAVRTLGKPSFTARCQQRAKVNFDKNARFAEYLDLYSTLCT